MLGDMGAPASRRATTGTNLIFIFFTYLSITSFDVHRILDRISEQRPDHSTGSAGTSDVAVAYCDQN